MIDYTLYRHMRLGTFIFSQGIFILIVSLIIVFWDKYGETLIQGNLTKEEYSILVLPLLVLYIEGNFLYEYIKGYLRRRQVEKLVSTGIYRDIVVIGLDVKTHKGKIVSYTYLCEDFVNKKKYKSDPLYDRYMLDIEIGDLVRLYEDDSNNAIYWVELTEKPSKNGLENLSTKAKEIGQRSFRKAEKLEDRAVIDNGIQFLSVLVVLFIFMYGFIMILTGVKNWNDLQILLVMVLGLSIFSVNLGLFRYGDDLARVMRRLIEGKGIGATLIKHFVRIFGLDKKR